MKESKCAKDMLKCEMKSAGEQVVLSDKSVGKCSSRSALLYLIWVQPVGKGYQQGTLAGY